jgi:hypothetical protein
MTHIYTQDPTARLLYVGGAAFPDGTPVRLGQPAHLPRLHSKQAWATADGKTWRMVERTELTRAAQ